MLSLSKHAFRNGAARRRASPAALHLDLFEQPAEDAFFSNLLEVAAVQVARQRPKVLGEKAARVPVEAHRKSGPSGEPWLEAVERNAQDAADLARARGPGPLACASFLSLNTGLTSRRQLLYALVYAYDFDPRRRRGRPAQAAPQGQRR